MSEFRIPTAGEFYEEVRNDSKKAYYRVVEVFNNTVILGGYKHVSLEDINDPQKWKPVDYTINSKSLPVYI